MIIIIMIKLIKIICSINFVIQQEPVLPTRPTLEWALGQYGLMMLHALGLRQGCLTVDPDLLAPTTATTMKMPVQDVYQSSVSAPQVYYRFHNMHEFLCKLSAKFLLHEFHALLLAVPACPSSKTNIIVLSGCIVLMLK